LPDLNRREVIKKLALSLPAGFVLPALQGCSTDDENVGSFDAKIVVIGAGAAGLHTASLLLSQGISVQVLEASSDFGGRIAYFKEGLTDFPLELGADEIIGNDNSWYELTNKTGVPIKNTESVVRYVLDGQIGTSEDFEFDTDFQIARGFRDAIPGYQGSDITVQNAIQSAGIKPRVQHILEGEIGNQYGSSNSRVGMRGISTSQRANATIGDAYVVEGQSHYTIFSSVFAAVKPHIQYNSPVTNIDYTGAKVIVSVEGGEDIEADKVVVTVPLSILQEGSVQFTPSLPGSKLNAINNLGMDAGMKVAIRFNGTFWGQETTSIISDGIVPRYYAPGIGRSKSNSVLSGYIMGSEADFLRQLPEEEIFNTLIAELDEMYDGNASRLVSISESGIDGVIKDWQAEPYIKGAYSYPKVGSSLARETLALPVNKQIFFGGEATDSRGNFGTVQGALDSGSRVVDELLQVLAEERVNG
jgi:monoamine oxidase